MAEKFGKTVGTVIVLTTIFLIMLLIPPVYADGDEDDIAEELGWVTVFAGFVATLPFNIYNFIRRNLQGFHSNGIGEVTRRLAILYKPLLHFHIVVNSVGTLAAVTHSFLLLEYVDGISLSLVIVILVVMATGALLYFTSGRAVKLFNRLLHTQVIITALMLILLILHIETAGE